jgi:LemA protein
MLNLFLVLSLTIIAIAIYNDLVTKKNQIDRAFSSIDVLLKKRCDLIPSLVSVVKHNMQFEQKTLVEITKLRSQVLIGNNTSEQRLTLENQISRTMGNILATIENYPELKSNDRISQLLATLNEVEEQISAARRFFNTAITEYNNAIEMFPNNIIASLIGYQSKNVFVATAEERQNVDVDRLFG